MNIDPFIDNNNIIHLDDSSIILDPEMNYLDLSNDLFINDIQISIMIEIPPINQFSFIDNIIIPDLSIESIDIIHS
jgi:hypothetical protein